MKETERKKRIGFAVTGSFCTHRDALAELGKLAAGNGSGEWEFVPILSEHAGTWDTRFGTAADLRRELTRICGREPIDTVAEAERLGPADPLDLLLICPCTGNTLAKLANGITDTTAAMAAKAHLRADRPLVIALASNDAMSANLCNIGTLLNRKNVYFVPMRQDDPARKPHSLVAAFGAVREALALAEEGKQMRPLFL
ncbi:MAG: dipicolinate synthase subunit B [Ruminococcaceae bacterium]|nr:dipicolinate synthase subunit B [Oscillospiraceae bacterium]